MKRKIIAAMTAILVGLTFTPTLKQAKADTDAQPSVSYTTHVQRIGWQNYVSNGSKAGTEGKGLRLEGIKIKVTGDSNLGVSYSTHVQKIGWQNAVSDNALSGTEGKALRLEGIKINLTGADKDKYDIYYRVHVQKQGWQGWVKDGNMAGTEGKGLRLEGIQIKIVQKNESAPPADNVSAANSEQQNSNVTTRTYRGTTYNEETGKVIDTTITETKTIYNKSDYKIVRKTVSDPYFSEKNNMLLRSIIDETIEMKNGCINTNTESYGEVLKDYNDHESAKEPDKPDNIIVNPPVEVRLGDQIIDGKIVHAK